MIKDFEIPVVMVKIPMFSEAEMMKHVGYLRNMKLTRPDGVLSEVACSCSHLLQHVHNTCLKVGVCFPLEGGEDSAPEPEEGPSKLPVILQTLCMLDTAGKVLEKVLKPRIYQASGDLSN